MPAPSASLFALILLARPVLGSPPFFEAAAAAAMQTIAMLECTDDSSACGGWAAGGECSKNPGFMHATCRKACGRCELQADDARHALEVVTYAVRNHHAGCAHAQQGGARLPECEGSAERLAATLAIAHEGATGRALQRVVEALAREVSASSPPPSRPLPWSPAAEATAVASVGGSAVGPFVQLSDGGRMPSVGVGTWLTTGSACYELVRAALRAGLRHIDTSENYANHGEIGRALAETSVPRGELPPGQARAFLLPRHRRLVDAGELFIADKLSFPHSYSAGGARKVAAEPLRLLGERSPRRVRDVSAGGGRVAAAARRELPRPLHAPLGQELAEIRPRAGRDLAERQRRGSGEGAERQERGSGEAAERGSR